MENRVRTRRSVTGPALIAVIVAAALASAAATPASTEYQVSAAAGTVANPVGLAAEPGSTSSALAADISLRADQLSVPQGASRSRPLVLEFRPNERTVIPAPTTTTAVASPEPALPTPAPAPEPPPAPPPAFVLPAQGRYTSCFCERWDEWHGGLDLANANGTPEVAAAVGTVIVAGPAGGFGQWVQVRHDDGTVTVYGHMDTIKVEIGQRVAAGELIATMGAQGNSTGPHLHFEVWPNGDRAQRIDPAIWLVEHGVALPEYTP